MKKKLGLNQLKVESFVTEIEDAKEETVKGGYITYGCTEGWAGCNGGGTSGSGGSGPRPTADAWVCFSHFPCDLR